METFCIAKPMIPDSHFDERRQAAVKEIDLHQIDTPLRSLIERLSELPYCFSLQCCWGHFVHDTQPDRHWIGPLGEVKEDAAIHYRLAYLAVCLKRDESGMKFLGDLKDLEKLDPEYLQFGSADWFWARQINSYAVQVMPDRFKDRDTAEVTVEEARHLEKVKLRMFEELDLLVCEKTAAI
jgi:hypothetical protein